MPKRAGRGTAVFEIFDHWHGLRHACGGEPARQSMIDSSKSNIGLGTCNQRLFSAIVRVSARLQNQWQTCSRLPPIFVQSFEIITESLMVYFSTHACFSPLELCAIEAQSCFCLERLLILIYSEWTWVERTWDIKACLTDLYIFTSCVALCCIITLKRTWPVLCILCVCVWCACEHGPMNTQGKETICGWFLYTECLAALPCADVPHFSVGSSFENHWRLFSARSPFQRSSLFQKGCDFQIYWVSLSTLTPLANQIQSNARLYSGLSACAAL